MNAGISVLIQVKVKWELECFKEVVKRWIYTGENIYFTY